MKELIRKKRDGAALAPEEIEQWVTGVADRSVPDYQSAALLMAIVCRGMDLGEMRSLTEAMLHSGLVLRWDGLGRPTVDKHSTGGVGDKVSIALAPWVAACGAAVPMIAGRGLGHTGGTLDKLESIPGFRTRIPISEFESLVRRIGLAMAGQTPEIAPADGVLYALRDATATVESTPLIVASIVSKKLASGASGVVFDVKCGGGAFMRTTEAARSLARVLTDMTHAMGIRAEALLSAMDQPLGNAIGNAIETEEAFAVLRGEGPPDVLELTRILARKMLVLCGVARETHEAEARLDRALESGRAVERAEAMVQAQGGDPRVVEDPDRLPRAGAETPVPSPRSGFLTGVHARRLGGLLVALGGGRERMEDTIDPAVGIRLLRKVGEPVQEGEPLALLLTRPGAAAPVDAARAAFTVGDAPVAPGPLVLEEIS